MKLAWSLHRLITWKLLFDGEGMTLDSGRLNLLRGIFLVMEMGKFSAVGWDFPTISKVFHKGLGEEGTVHTWWMQQSNIKGGDVSVKTEIPGYNSRSSSCWTLFCIKRLRSIKLFQTSHDCVTENAKMVKFPKKLLEMRHGGWRNLIFWWGRYPTEGKSSNVWVCWGITFPTSSVEDCTVSISVGYIVLMPIPEKD